MGSYNARLIYPIGYTRRCCGATAVLIRQPQTHPHNEEPGIRNRIIWEGVRYIGLLQKMKKMLDCLKSQLVHFYDNSAVIQLLSTALHLLCW